MSAQQIHVHIGTVSGNALSDVKFIQGAVDYVARLGGGVVELPQGTLPLNNAIHLRSGVRLVGQGERTTLLKNPSVTTPLTDDTDWYERRVTVADPTGFEVGGGILLRGKHVHGQGWTITKHTILGIRGNEFFLDSQPRANLWITHEATASTLFPMVTANYEHDFSVENLTIDGNRDENGNLDGNYGGCVFIQDCERVQIREVVARNNNGDGISWQVCHDVAVENCLSEHHTGLGLHPGSGSQRPVIRGNTVRDCNVGLYWCWGVKFGVAEDNVLEDCDSGSTIGHRDTDNLIRNNRIHNCRKVGFLFRADDPPIRAAHRNVLEDNEIRDIGTEDALGVGIRIDAEVEDVVIRRNHLIDSKGVMSCGIRIACPPKNLVCEENVMDGIRERIVER